MKRSELKALVKECLTEILAEGLGNVQLVESKEPRDETRFGAVAEAANKRQRALKSQRNTRGPAPSPALQRAVLEESRGNPILKDIFADTAMTTLQQQIAYDRPGAPVGAVEMAMADSSPQELFGDDNAEKWAQLAFTDRRPGLLAKKSS